MRIALSLALVTLQSLSTDYERAIERARAGELEESRAILIALRDANPSDKRPHIELAGIAFRQSLYGDAKRHISSALRIDPYDAYATDFLATLYLLEDNIEAALKYWNRLGEPRIDRVRIDPPFEIDPVLWDRAFAFSPSSVLTLEDFRDTRARLDSLELLAGGRFDLVPSGADMDLEFHPVPLGGRIGSNRWSTIGAVARGLPYETVQLDFMNIASKGINASTLARWDSAKRRAEARVAIPLGKEPGRRFEVTVDGRDESWVLPAEEFRLRRLKGSARIESQINHRWTWVFGLNFSDRNSGKRGDRNGFLMTYETGITHRLLTVPERRLYADVGLSTEFGKRYFKGTGQMGVRWVPGTADNYEATGHFRFGGVWGDAPFDELFVLGLDRDHELLLRGHPGSGKGRKGQGPLGRAFMLWNLDLLRNVFREPFFSVRAGPFVDLARVTGERRFFVDGGIRMEVALVNGLRLDFSLGADLYSGRTATFYRSRWE